MKIRIKLFGTLGQNFPGYDSLKSMDVNIPDDARVNDLLAHLGIPDTSNYLVIMNKTIAKSTDRLIHGATLHIFQAMAGG
ncbi:MoaD/ThiS family protein [Desulfobacula phenolica]|uniref:ThiS family protein n=1 Tax=Desulfobacula phenolica TaxID=90732 RepID=A0A1H2IAG0_9BACT|nr:MoaD/ThiS family protein [Desulfobacula phenolica]SDU41132.1 ThiS family protein [Desulfobacula phenolica]